MKYINLWISDDASEKLMELLKHNEMEVDDYLEELIYQQHYITAPYIEKEEE